MTHILLVDDEPDLIWAVRRSLSDEGYIVLTASDGVEALNIAQRQRPDLVILDIMMPHMDGLQVCHTMRRDATLATVPILFLTGRDAIEDRIQGLDEGADDYLIKPFDLRELKARVRALLRRGTTQAAPPAAPEGRRPLLIVGALRLDCNTYQVSVQDKTVPLTPAEFDLLHYLMQHPDEVFSSQHLLKHVWGYAPEAAEPGLVRWHIMNLRAKIEPDPARPIYIRTIPRHGYLLAGTGGTR